MHEQLITLNDAFNNFIDAGETQSQAHIKLLHWHIAERLVIGGGFNPDDIVPRPPLRVETTGKGKSHRSRLVHDPTVAVPGERTILGGLKTKDVDVVISKDGVGPCIAISVKGTLSAFRNLTNRMEEAAGDCTNIHISYPNLIYGFFHVIKANHASNTKRRNDVAIESNEEVVAGIVRYHDAIARLTGRKDVRNDVSRYEAVALAMVDASPDSRGHILQSFPTRDSPIRFEQFFDAIYRIYDLRYVYTAPALRRTTARSSWSEDSPASSASGADAFNFRFAPPSD
ncbi:MAG: hypothetical protein H8E66_33045 [Planctomycetes bacterium]|nr:hypothetical protein [Planctomycetota bacterium]